ncbi:MAG: universal stress protein, partial [Kiloniellales bacterium]
MTRNNEIEPPHRILVALEAEEGAAALLEAAADLAAGLHAELFGLFVEDSELLGAAELPVTRSISSLAEAQAPLDARLMRRALRVSAVRAGEALAAVAQRRRVKFSYRVVQGALAEQVLAEARRYDLLALGPPGREVRRAPVTVARRAVAEQAPCSVLLLQGGGAAGRPVVVIYDGSERSLALGERLARITERPLLVLAVAENEDGVSDLVRRAKDWERRHHGRARVLGAVGE